MHNETILLASEITLAKLRDGIVLSSVETRSGLPFVKSKCLNAASFIDKIELLLT